MHACITLIGCAKNEGKIPCVIAQADQAAPLLFDYKMVYSLVNKSEFFF